jgi:hypothetical protein
LLRRFTELNDAEQLQTFVAIRDFLATRKVVLKSDGQIEDRAAAVEAVARVARHLGLEDATKLKVKQFNEAPEEIRDGWTVNRIIKACDTWRAARESAAGGNAKLSARQRALLSALKSRALLTDDYVTSVRQWLDTKPLTFGYLEYDEWVTTENATRGDDELLLPSYNVIRRSLGLGWRNMLRVASGELSVKAAQQAQLARTPRAASGEFAAMMDIVRMTERTYEVVRRFTRTDDFPVPALVIAGRRHWLRSDITAYFAGESFPKRELNELKGLYVDVNEAAKILGVSTNTMTRGRGAPDPKYTGAHRLWLRSEIVAWRDERSRRGPGRGRHARRLKKRN